MKLLLDIGNTRIKWAFDAGDELLHADEFIHRDTANDQAIGFVEQLAEIPTDALACNVAGVELGDAIAQEIERRFGLELRFAVSEKHAGPVTNAYDDASQLGADRWAAIIGAYSRFCGAVCVVDAGTAVTVDLVGSGGDHLGGLIVPGLQMMAASLNRGTRDIEAFSRKASAASVDSGLLGRDTASAVQKGALAAIGGLIDLSMRHLNSAAGGDAVIVITGGDAAALLPIMQHPFEHHPLLVLEGLKALSDQMST